MDPCAGGQWDVQGRYVSGPERQDLLRIPATVSAAGRIVIDTLDVSASPPVEVPPEATPEQAPSPAPAPEWLLIPTVANPPRPERSGISGALVTFGRGWGVTPADAAALLMALALVAGAAAYVAASLLRAARRPASGADVYLEWRNGRRWSRYPEPAPVLAPGEEQSVRVRLVNEGKAVARGVSLVIDAEWPLLVELDARAGIVARALLPDGVQLRWEFNRSLPPRGRSRVETVRLSRSPDTEAPGLTRVIVVRCRPSDGDRETSTHVAVILE